MAAFLASTNQSKKLNKLKYGFKGFGNLKDFIDKVSYNSRC
jgi:hypothetical protein